MSQTISQPGFYRAFEDRYRGSRELIKQRLAQYQPFLDALKHCFADCRALDIGCGRGEWLELLSDQGFQAKGIDLDEGMLVACQERNLDVTHGDALTFLKTCRPNSLHLISAFHVVEHITFEQRQELIALAYQILVPGGLLLMETPNPESLLVSTTEFYLDPTHVKPIPPDLLAFSTEYAGFSRNKILRLQEPQGILQKPQISLVDLVYAVSPDYAVLAQKPNPALADIFDSVFDPEYGITLKALLHRVEQRMQQSEMRVKEIQSEIVQVQQTNNLLHNELRTVYQSRSWRLTRPIREVKHWLSPKWRWFKQGTMAWFTMSPHSRPYRLLRKSVWNAVDYVRARPKLKNRLVNLLEKMPWVRNRLAQLLIRQRATQEGVMYKNTQLSVPAETIFQQLELLKNASVKTGD
ncbi:class I SAM-dependent methyltransferase [Thiomicrorhabdus cannonii]|uniref:class I SAM-dependent methyltransferase n=1 Tax=Thiomicrorhabdus cannonii TaxID=2748011 RepID=UPI0015B9850D|nr:class I SAM-dependent methyltransferase [Thiomicrorhabdus cannonii]